MFSSFVETGAKYKYVSVWDEPVGSVRTPGDPLKFFIHVEAKSDCHIWLSDCGSKTSTKRGYEIVIGGWNNTRSEIRRGQQGTALACCLHKTSPLDSKCRSKFWIAVIEETSDHSTTVVVGEGWDIWKNKFLISVDKRAKFSVSSLSVSTGFGHTGKWSVYMGEDPEETAQPPQPIMVPARKLVPLTPIRETLVATGCVSSTVASSSSSPACLLKRPRMNFGDIDENIFFSNNDVVSSAVERKQVGFSINETLAKYHSANPQPPAKRRI